MPLSSWGTYLKEGTCPVDPLSSKGGPYWTGGAKLNYYDTPRQSLVHYSPMQVSFWQLCIYTQVNLLAMLTLLQEYHMAVPTIVR